ncbi:LuxR C-terminal-related transcriptional regulator [Nocardia paucivorans]|uniref:LuxR C-terminal-related transcriptional regulator n=1 Tax=Nocardia paucivorans TaxID=114259 RepID=UPI000A076E82
MSPVAVPSAWAPSRIVRALGTRGRTESVVQALRMRRLDPNAIPLPEQPLRLSPRERGILPLVAAGLTNSRIASHIPLSAETVKAALPLLHRKLGVSGRTGAVVEALHSGEIDLDGTPTSLLGGGDGVGRPGGRIARPPGRLFSAPVGNPPGSSGNRWAARVF